MNPGLRVCHPRHGVGTVRMRLGREVLVHFDAKPGPALRVFYTELVPFVPGSPREAAGSIASPSAAESPRDTRVSDMRLLEALRMGVVPHDNADAYTVGRAPVLAQLRSDLRGLRDYQYGAFRVVMGDYGTGKTHLLEWLRETALAQNFLVANATLGAGDASPAQPKRLYRALVQGLCYPDAEGDSPGLRPLFERLVQTRGKPKSSTLPGYHKYLDAVAFLFSKLDLADQPPSETLQALLDWIEGHPSGDNQDWNQLLRRQVLGAPYLYALADYRTFAHVYAYLLGGIAVLARECGWSGLVLLLDEADRYSVLSQHNREFADNVFRCYALAALGPSGVKFRADAIRSGGHRVHRDVPVQHAARQPLMCVFCITPSGAGGLTALGQCVDLDRYLIELGPLTTDDYRDLVVRVALLFDRLHPGCAPSPASLQRVAQHLARGAQRGAIHNPRAAIRMVVEYLDIQRLRPELAPEWLSELGQILGA